MGGNASGLTNEEQDKLLSRWQEIRNRSSRREQTGDRVILAERLRRHLVDSGEGTKEVDNCDDVNFPVKAHVKQVNGRLAPETIKLSTGSI